MKMISQYKIDYFCQCQLNFMLGVRWASQIILNYLPFLTFCTDLTEQRSLTTVVFDIFFHKLA